MIVQEPSRNELSCSRRNMRPGEGVFHWHENCEIVLVVNAPCRFRLDGEIIQAQPGDLVFFGEQAVHQYLIEEDSVQVCIFQLHPLVLLNGTGGILPLRTHITRKEILAISGLWERLNSLMLLIEQEGRAAKAAENPYLQSLLIALYSLLCRHFAGELPADRREQKSDFYRVVEYVNTHFEERITVNSVADHFHFSRGKLSQIFKKYAGIGVNDYTNTLRIKKANGMLANGATVTQAALSSGFDSIRTFNNVYKKVTGVSPSEYFSKKSGS